MFNSSKDNSTPKAKNGGPGSGIYNTFASGTIIHGEVNSEGDVRIDGKINGTLISKAKVVIGASGSVEGDVFCQNASIEGRVKGKLEVGQLLDLKKTARIDGDIVTKKIVVEEGAKFNGTCSMTGSKSMINGESSKQSRPELKKALKKEAV